MVSFFQYKVWVFAIVLKDVRANRPVSNCAATKEPRRSSGE